jgi:hypothetical protein
MRHRKIRNVQQLLAIVVGVAGCGNSKDATYPVQGRIMFTDGQPMTGGSISFRAIDRRPPISARGMIQPDGSFTLSTFSDRDGAVAGRHQIVVSTLPSREPREGFESPIYPRIDEKFSRFETSGLEVTVSSDASQNRFTLEVTAPPKANN